MDLPHRRTHVPRCLNLRKIECIYRIVDRKHHEKDVGVDHGDKDPRATLEERYGIESESADEIVGHTVVVENHQPGENAQQFVDGVGNDQTEHEDRGFPGSRQLCHGVGDGVADKKSNHRHRHGGENGLQEDEQVAFAHHRVVSE